MGKIDDIQAYKEWTEYHRSLKRDKAADNLSPVERKKKLEKLEANVIEWILFFSRNSQSTPLPNSIKRPSNASPRIWNGTRFYRGHVSWQNPPSCSCA